MVKRTLYFGNPAYLKTKTEQLIIEKQEDGELVSVPIEDIGLLILDRCKRTKVESKSQQRVSDISAVL